MPDFRAYDQPMLIEAGQEAEYEQALLEEVRKGLVAEQNELRRRGIADASAALLGEHPLTVLAVRCETNAGRSQHVFTRCFPVWDDEHLGFGDQRDSPQEAASIIVVNCTEPDGSYAKRYAQEALRLERIAAELRRASLLVGGGSD